MTGGIQRSLCHIWQQNHHIPPYNSPVQDHRPHSWALSEHPAGKEKGDSDIYVTWCITRGSTKWSKQKQPQLNWWATGSPVSSWWTNTGCTQGQTAPRDRISWLSPVVFKQMFHSIFCFFYFHFCFLVLTWVLVTVLRAGLDVSLLAAWCGFVGSSSLCAAQSPKTMQVSPGFYVNIHYSALKAKVCPLIKRLK